MNILKWVLVIVIAYVAGYFSHFPDAELMSVQAAFVPEGCPPPLSAFDEIETALQEDRERVERLKKAQSYSQASSSKINEQEKIAAQPVPEQLRQAQTKAPIATPYVNPNQAQTPPVKSNISDEEIDKLVPTPYNDVLKRMNGPIREKYKEFAGSNQQEDWDTNTQNRITDALLGHSYSKFIELESVTCKASLCEVRGRELKPQVINLIFAELQLQEWWHMGDSQLVTGMNNVFYGLFMRRPSVMQQ